MKYIAILKQNHGCDYTIGCGIKELLIHAVDINDATKELERIIKTNYLYHESEIVAAELFEINKSIEINVSELKNFSEEEKNISDLEMQTNAELAELKRLKNKYEAS